MKTQTQKTVAATKNSGKISEGKKSRLNKNNAMKKNLLFFLVIILMGSLSVNGQTADNFQPSNYSDSDCLEESFFLAPANDNCSGATLIFSGPSCTYTSGTISGATQSIPAISCGGYTSTLCTDVWYRFKAASTSHTIRVVPSSGMDAVVNLRSGSCNGSNIQCSDNGGGEGGTETIYATGLTVGSYYYVRVYDYTGASISPSTYTFNICVTHTPASCTITSLSPSSETHSAEAFSTSSGDDIIVNGQAYCTFNVTNNCSWVTVSPMSGSMNQVGQVLLNYSITAWNGTSSRTCTFYINGSPFTITQNGCSNDFDDGTESATAAGKTYSLGIDAYSACDWTITNPCSQWVTINQSSGTGQSDISVTVAPNNTCTSRTCTLTISPGGDTHVITQQGIAAPSISLSPASPHFCQGQGPVTVTATGATSYSWTPSNGLSSTTVSNPLANPNSTTTYTVTGTSNGCTGSASITVTVNPPASISATPANPSYCTGSNGVQINAAGGSGNNYIWTPATGLSNANIANPLASPASNTTYTVTGANSNGCSGSATVSVAVHNPPALNITPSNPTICTGGSIQLFVSGANTYSWSPSSGLNTTSGSVVTANPTGIGPHTYTVTGTDVYGCTNTSTVTVTATNSPAVTVSANIQPPYCQGQTVILTPSITGASYLWTPTNQTTNSIGVSSTGTYSVAVTNPSGCTGTYTSAPLTVTINQNPTVPVISVTPNPACAGQAVSFSTSSPGPGYTWSGPNGFHYTVQNPPTINSVGILSTGNYTLTVTNTEGCSAVSNVINLVVNDTNVTITGDPTVCSGQYDTLTATQGTSYLWAPGGQTTQSVYVNSSGVYTVTVTNPNFCSGAPRSAFITVSSSSSPPVPAISITNAGNGHINLVASPSTGYNYQWYLNMTGTSQPIPGATGSILFNADSLGYYSVNISDISTGCNTMSVLIWDPAIVSEIDQENIVLIHPNPAKDKIIVELNSEFTCQKGYLMIYNSIGELMLDKNFEKLNTEVDIADFAKGMYYLIIKLERGLIAKKIIKE